MFVHIYNVLCVILGLGLQVKCCDERLTKIQVPHDFNRTVRG